MVSVFPGDLGYETRRHRFERALRETGGMEAALELCERIDAYLYGPDGDTRPMLAIPYTPSEDAAAIGAASREVADRAAKLCQDGEAAVYGGKRYEDAPEAVADTGSPAAAPEGGKDDVGDPPAQAAPEAASRRRYSHSLRAVHAALEAFAGDVLPRNVDIAEAAGVSTGGIPSILARLSALDLIEFTTSGRGRGSKRTLVVWSPIDAAGHDAGEEDQPADDDDAGTDAADTPPRIGGGRPLQLPPELSRYERDSAFHRAVTWFCGQGVHVAWNEGLNQWYLDTREMTTGGIIAEANRARGRFGLPPYEIPRL